MDEASRYAIYYAPETNSKLANFGSSWLGWDAEQGRKVDHPAYSDLPIPVSEITSTPHKYGFHGTLKAPFHLANGYEVAELDAAAQDLASSISTFEIPHIKLAELGRFLAIVPAKACKPLSNLAEACVRKLDGFRATPSEAYLARRRQANLTETQDAMLMRWGYPYVMSEFRFHLTLSGALNPDHIPAIKGRITQELSDTLNNPLPVKDICLFREAEDGHFHIVKRYPLGA